MIYCSTFYVTVCSFSLWISWSLLYTFIVSYYNHCDPPVLFYHPWTNTGLWYLHPLPILSLLQVLLFKSRSNIVDINWSHTRVLLFFPMYDIQLRPQFSKPVCLHDNLNTTLIPHNHLSRRSHQEFDETSKSFFLFEFHCSSRSRFRVFFSYMLVKTR